MAVHRATQRREPDLEPRFHQPAGGADGWRRLIEQVERREVVHTTETLGRYSERWLARRRPYLEKGTWAGYAINGRRRLLPAFAEKRLGALPVENTALSSPSKPAAKDGSATHANRIRRPTSLRDSRIYPAATLCSVAATDDAAPTHVARQRR